MRNLSRRIAAGLVVAVGVSLTGCGGSSGSKPHAQIRAVDVGTNLVNTTNNTDTATVLVNGGASYEQVPYGSPSSYLYVESGTSTFQGSTSITLPTVTPAGGTATTVQPPKSTANLADGGTYTAFLVGRPDVPNPTQTDLSDLDPRYMKVVTLSDAMTAPTAGHATVRALNAVTDPSTPNIDIYISGQGSSPVFANVPYASQATGATAEQSLNAGTVTVSANVAGSGTVLLAPTTVTLASGAKYTLVITEPTATWAGAATAPTPAPTTTYGVTLVTEP